MKPILLLKYLFLLVYIMTWAATVYFIARFLNSVEPEVPVSDVIVTCVAAVCGILSRKARGLHLFCLCLAAPAVAVGVYAWVEAKPWYDGAVEFMKHPIPNPISLLAVPYIIGYVAIVGALILALAMLALGLFGTLYRIIEIRDRSDEKNVKETYLITK